MRVGGKKKNVTSRKNRNKKKTKSTKRSTIEIRLKHILGAGRVSQKHASQPIVSFKRIKSREISQSLYAVVICIAVVIRVLLMNQRYLHEVED